MSWKGLLSKNVAEIRFLACPASSSSVGVREWFASNYETLKLLNPRVPLIMRENPMGDPYIIVKFDYLEQRQVDVTDLTAAQVEAKIEELIKSGAEFESAPLNTRLQDVVE